MAEELNNASDLTNPLWSIFYQISGGMDPAARQQLHDQIQAFGASLVSDADADPRVTDLTARIVALETALPLKADVATAATAADVQSDVTELTEQLSTKASGAALNNTDASVAALTARVAALEGGGTTAQPPS